MTAAPSLATALKGWQAEVSWSVDRTMEERSAQVRSAPAAQPRASARPASATLYLLSGSGCSKARALEKTMCCTGGHLGIHMLTTTSASPPHDDADVNQLSPSPTTRRNSQVHLNFVLVYFPPSLLINKVHNFPTFSIVNVQNARLY